MIRESNAWTKEWKTKVIENLRWILPFWETFFVSSLVVLDEWCSVRKKIKKVNLDINIAGNILIFFCCFVDRFDIWFRYFLFCLFSGLWENQLYVYFLKLFFVSAFNIQNRNTFPGTNIISRSVGLFHLLFSILKNFFFSLLFHQANKQTNKSGIQSRKIQWHN